MSECVHCDHWWDCEPCCRCGFDGGGEGCDCPKHNPGLYDEDGQLKEESNMESPVTHNNKSDDEGRPAGGCTHGRGFTIAWQDGPLGRDGDRIEPNGAFVEDVISAAIGRIEFYQDSPFNSEYNARALLHLIGARDALRERTANREERGVEGTHAP